MGRSKNRGIVVLDDDLMAGKILSKALGLKYQQFTSTSQLKEVAGELNPFAAFVDIHLGIEENGLDFLPELKKKWDCPILVITSDPTESAIQEALACGADDFIRKPIQPPEVQSRLRRRIEDRFDKEGTSILRFEDIALEKNHRRLTGPSGDAYLPQIEFNILVALLNNSSTVNREVLKRHGWGKLAVSNNTLDRKIYELRRAFQTVTSQLTIQNHYGKGFALERAKPTKKSA